jgi:uncharacterized protein (DUF1778 family)
MQDHQRIQVRVTPQQGAVIVAAANDKGLPVATWLRTVALEAANQQLGRHPAVPRRPKVAAQ